MSSDVTDAVSRTLIAALMIAATAPLVDNFGKFVSWMNMRKTHATMNTMISRILIHRVLNTPFRLPVLLLLSAICLHVRSIP
jgi:hypothetical protein